MIAADDDVARTAAAACALANDLECAARCPSCGGWQTSTFDPSRAELVVYCGGCGIQLGPTIDVWPLQPPPKGTIS